MNLNFLNPFSDEFLQKQPDQEEIRAQTMQNNSVGVDEDVIDWSRLVNRYNTNDQFGLNADTSNILFDAIFATKRQRISFYRSMALYPLCKKAITMITDEAVCENSKHEIAKFDIKESFQNKFTKAEFEQLKKEFDYIINCVIKKQDIWNYFYRWIVDGEQFWELCPNDKGSALAGIKILPAYCSLVVYQDGVAQGYVEDPRMLDLDSKEEIKKFTLEQISYSSYGQWGLNRNDIRGHLEAAIRPLNQLRAIEDALTVYRITRAPEKRIFNIYTGRLPPPQVPGFMNDIKNKYRKSLTIDPTTGMINSSKNVQAFTEDFWFAKDDQGTGSSVESFKGSTEFNGQLDDVKMFQQQFMDAMQVPNCRWNDTESPTNYATTPEQMLSEISFQKLCKRLAQKFADELILHTFIQQLRLRDYDKKYLDSSVYNITLNGANDFQKLRELAHAEKVGGLIGTFSQFLPTLTNSKDSSEDLQPIFSKQYFMEKILCMTSDDILLNQKLLDEEKKKLIDKANAAKDESAPEDTDESEQGDDLGF